MTRGRGSRWPGRGAGLGERVRRWSFGAGLGVALGFGVAPGAAATTWVDARPIAIGSSAAAVAASVQTTPTNAEEEARRAISLLRSPYCPGFMLEVCPSAQAEALRDSIYDLAAQGMTSNELVEWMIANHGEEWRGLPQRSGIGLWAWIIPPLALLLGIGAFVGWLRANRRSGPEEVAGEPSPISESDREQLTAAMRDWEESGQEELP